MINSHSRKAEPTHRITRNVFKKLLHNICLSVHINMQYAFKIKITCIKKSKTPGTQRHHVFLIVNVSTVMFILIDCIAEGKGAMAPEMCYIFYESPF